MARYVHATDSKGRMFIPARLRDGLGGTVYVTKSLDQGYLAVYTVEQFDVVRRQINELSGTDPVARVLRREIIGEAIRCPLDSQGRIGVTEELWRYIGVTGGDEVCVINLFDSMAICSKALYEQMAAMEPAVTELDLSGYDVKGIL